MPCSRAFSARFTGLTCRAPHQDLRHVHVTLYIQSETVQRVGKVVDAQRRSSWVSPYTDRQSTSHEPVDTHQHHVVTTLPMSAHRRPRRLDQRGSWAEDGLL
ncbi:MAG: hypothetical protein OXP73_08390 [Chloroflexota bacterium]|nr:hypothetical protein [Chloroflexota bacterium]